jgi:hypothetical protein
MKWLAWALLIAGLLAAWIPDQQPPDDAWKQLTVTDAPWTIHVPPDWRDATEVSKPGPRDRVGMMTTAISSVRYRPDERAPSPNGRGGASQLPDDGAVVLLHLLWTPGEKPWNPRGTDTTRLPPSKWHDDAQNPGWQFRERKMCVGARSCVSILEWHGPDTSPEQLGRMEEIVSAVELATE